VELGSLLDSFGKSISEVQAALGDQVNAQRIRELFSKHGIIPVDGPGEPKLKGRVISILKLKYPLENTEHKDMRTKILNCVFPSPQEATELGGRAKAKTAGRQQREGKK
jgi:hypothetical protein